MISKRESIIAAIGTRLKLIQIANDYATDAGTCVVRARKYFELEDMPCLTFWPGIETTVNSNYNTIICTVPFIVELFATYDQDDIESASKVQESLLADVIKCMTDPLVPHSDLISQVLYMTGGPADQPNPGETITASSAAFNITYEYKTGEPYV